MHTLLDQLEWHILVEFRLKYELAEEQNCVLSVSGVPECGKPLRGKPFF